MGIIERCIGDWIVLRHGIPLGQTPCGFESRRPQQQKITSRHHANDAGFLRKCPQPAALSPLLRHALGWRVGRQGDPGVALLLPHRDGRCGEIGVGETADGDGDVSGKAFALPVDGRAACRTEMKSQSLAAFGCPHPGRRLAGERDLIAAEASLVADHGAGAALALQAVAHGDAQWFTLNRKLKLRATACGASGHELAPWLSMV